MDKEVTMVVIIVSEKKKNRTLETLQDHDMYLAPKQNVLLSTSTNSRIYINQIKSIASDNYAIIIELKMFFQDKKLSLRLTDAAQDTCYWRLEF